MIYQFLRVALCVALLTGTTANAVGKRALWNFVEAKKELQKKLAELRKMDATADVDKSSALADEIQGYINDVAKLDPTKASEFQEVLDASFEQEIGTLSLEAEKQKQALMQKIDESAQKIEANNVKIKKAVTENTPIPLFDDGASTSSESKGIPGLKEANNRAYLDYLTYVTIPVSAIIFPFTKLITKSYKMSLRLLDFITRESVAGIHNTYLGILQQEKDALEAGIVNTSLVAALKINGFLNRLTAFHEKDPKDVSEKLIAQEKRWFLGKIYEKAETVASSLRTKDTFSGSQLHAIILGELLEYNALLTPLVDFGKHPGLTDQLININSHLTEFLYLVKNKNSFTEGEKNLIAALYEMHYTLESANEESKNILDSEKKSVYPNGKLSLYFTFAQNNNDFETILTAAGIDKTKMIDTRSWPQKVKAAIAAKKIGAYKDEFAALAGLVLTVAGGSYFVEQYLPQYKNKFTAYAAAPINYVITLLNAYFKVPSVFGASDAVKQKAATALSFIKSKIKQLPYSDKIATAISSSWVKAVSFATGGAHLVGRLYSRVRGQAYDSFSTEDKQWEEQQSVYERFYADDIQAAKALQESHREFDLQEYRREVQEVEKLSDTTGDNNADLQSLFQDMEPLTPEEEKVFVVS